MRFFPIAVGALLLACPLRAAEPEPIELTIHARSIETPVLNYRLFPAEAEMKPGNAAPILLRLPWGRENWMTQVFPTLQQWESRPLDAPEWATSGGVLPDEIVNEMKRAAFRREAMWEYPIGEAPPLYSIRLPDAQGLRGFLDRGLGARIRYHISRGELAEAREGIMIGLANARHLAQTPFYVTQLMAVAIDRTMLDRTAELISQPDSPNLYWALSTLPDSLIELGRTASLEGDFFRLSFPAVDDLDRPRERAEWMKMASQLVVVLDEFDELPKHPKQDESALVRRLLAQWAQAARDELAELMSMSAEKVAAMSDEEAGIRWYVRNRLAIDQRAAAVIRLPPREAWPQLARLRDDVQALHENSGTKKSDDFDSTSIYLSIWSLKRKVQLLRIIEAVRDHLATHDGKLPAGLDDIAELPIPLDPLTDQPFEWRVFQNNAAILKAPPLPASALEPDSAGARANMLEYWLQAIKRDEEDRS
jgi:hypothetical protein